jgi:hypothetical protein
VQEYDDSMLEPLAADGITVPLLRLGTEDQPPDSEVKVGAQSYKYDCSYPLKGYAAVMPAYLKQQMAAGKKPLVIERPSRFYLYLG